ncbi:hypothetical protein [Metabacillus halosaccharovorans]|uniref:hypothetical protein n=1 Tax=Metabacillus halosaccharovorans TaxID=930124 RepID=UPI001116DA06|nr:hypothetical protein [Metabacillus halosaccharovorans]
MKRKFTKISLILLSLLLLFGCVQDMTEQSEVAYKIGFPTENSQALTEFIHFKMTTNRGILLQEKDDIFINTIESVSSDEKTINYYKYSENQLTSYIEPLLDKEDPKSTFTTLTFGENAGKTINQSIDKPQEYNLPLVTMQENNHLKIETNSGEMILQLSEIMRELNVKDSDRLIFNLSAVNEELFALEIEDTSIEVEEGGSLYLGLFVRRDLSDYVVSSLHFNDLQKTLESGELDNYLEVFPKVDSEGKYSYLFGDTIVDTQKNQIITIKEDDLLSKDGQYVYINGKKPDLTDGTQQIQSIENYANDNDTYEAEFVLDFDTIAKKLELETNGVSTSNINYFNENFVILGLNFTGTFVGTAGFTNVIVDLQNDKNPTAYLVDLGME